MKLTDFDNNIKIRLTTFSEGRYFYWDEYGLLKDNVGGTIKAVRLFLEADNWEVYGEPRKKETWYRYEYKVKGESPSTQNDWYKNKHDFIYMYWADTKLPEFDVEPRVCEKKEF